MADGVNAISQLRGKVDANHALVTLAEPYGLQVAKGLVSGVTGFSKFGRNGAVGTTTVPVAAGGIYKTPTTATALEIVSSSANDTAAGSGAQSVTVVGLDTNWAELSQTIATNGTTPVAVPTNLLRVYRMFVASSGTYATQSAGSHAGTITVRESGAGATWATLDLVNSFPQGQSLIGAYTVPAGHTLYVDTWFVSVESTKPASVQFFRRSSAHDVTTPFAGAIRVQKTWEGLVNDAMETETVPLKFEAYTDLGFMASVAAGTAEVSVTFSGYLVG